MVVIWPRLPITIKEEKKRGKHYKSIIFSLYVYNEIKIKFNFLCNCNCNNYNIIINYKL